MGLTACASAPREQTAFERPLPADVAGHSLPSAKSLGEALPSDLKKPSMPDAIRALDVAGDVVGAVLPSGGNSSLVTPSGTSETKTAEAVDWAQLDQIDAAQKQHRQMYDAFRKFLLEQCFDIGTCNFRLPDFEELNVIVELQTAGAR
jgi:hypothetical protein